MAMRQRSGEVLLRAVVRHPGWVLLLTLVPLVLALACLPKLQKDVRSDAFLAPSDPAILARDRVKAQFGLSDPLVVALDAGAPGALYRPANLALLAQLTDAVAALPNVDAERVMSLATESNITARGDALDITPFLDPLPRTLAQARDVGRAVSRFPLYQGSLVSTDGSMALLVVELVDETQAEQSYFRLRRLLADTTLPDTAPSDTMPSKGVTLHLAGEGAVSGYMGSYVDADARRLIPVAWLIITAVVFLAFRRLGPALQADVVMLASVAIAVGAMAALGIRFFVISNALPVILIGISVADTIHIYSHYYDLRARYPATGHAELVARTVREMWRPVTITSLTTMAGFVGLAWASFMPPFEYFGWFAALGVACAWLYSLLALPALMVLFPPRATAELAAPALQRWAGGGLEMLGNRVLAHTTLVLGLGALLMVAGAYAMTRVQVDDDPIRVFHPGEPVAVADRLINQRMNGTNTLDVVVEAPAAEGLFDPGRLRRIEALQAYVATLPEVGGSVSIVDYLKQMNRALHGDDPAYYRVPDSAQAVAQFFLLYAALSDPSDFEEEVDYDYRTANVRIYARSGGYLDTAALVEGVERYVSRHFGSEDGDGLRATVSGRLQINHRWVRDLAAGHFGGLLLTLVMVWATAALLFRSLLAGCLTLVPVLASVLTVYAAMAVTGITLGMGTSMFAAIAVGLGIDFAIHVLARLQAAGPEYAGDRRQAYLSVYRDTGRPLLFNALAVASGFGILTISEIVSLTTFGWIVMLAITTSFIASVTLLPAMLWRLPPALLPVTGERTSVRRGILRWVLVLVLCAVAAITVPGALAAEPPLAADEIVARVNAVGAGRPLGRKVRMTLTDSRGKQRVRETVNYRKQVDGAQRTVVFYLSPANVRDTAFLTWDYADSGREDDQWLYLPALRKSRKVPAADRGDYFLGTDLTYEDIKLDGKLSPEDYHFTTTGSEKEGEYQFYLLEGRPRTAGLVAELGYSRLEARVDASTWLVTEVEFYGPDGQLLKTLEVGGIAEVDGVWTRTALQVANARTGHRTRFEFYDIDYHSNVGDELFTRQALERGAE